MDNLKRSMKRFFTRLSILAIVVVCGAIAIAQAQRDKPEANSTAAKGLAQPATPDAAEAGDQALAPIRDVDRDWARATPPSFSEHPPAAHQPARTAVDSLAGPYDVTQPEPDVVVDDQVQQVDYETESRYGNEAAFASDARPAASPGRDRFGGPPPEDGFDAPVVDAFGAPPVDGFGPPDLIDEANEFPTDQHQVELQEEEPFDDQLGAVEQAAPAPRPPGRFGAVTNPPPATTDSFRDARSQDFRGPQTVGNNPIRGNTLPPPVGQPVPERTPPPSYEPPATDRFASDVGQEALGNEASYPAENFSADSVQEELPPAAGNLAMPGAGRPGPRELEGIQSPSISLQKIAPADVRVGEPATFQIKIRNTGQVPAERIVIRDEVPEGTTLVATTPQATPDASGAVLWSIGTLRPGEDATVSMQVTPIEEGEIGSVATVALQAQASARAESTKPLLEIVHEGPQKVLVGEAVKFTIALSNPGSGPATKVILEEDVPEGLTHTQGPQLEYEVGTIAAGGNRRLELSLTAEKPGMVDNIIRARAAGGLTAEHRIQLEVVAPQLQVKVKGPARRYLDRKATFSVSIENPGTAAAKNVELTTRLPPGLRFVSTNNSGRFDPTNNTIRWSLDQLPARQFGEVQFTATPTQMGEFDIAAEGIAEMGLADSKTHHMVVEGIAALLFTVIDQDPIEVGSMTTYEIKVKNQGTGDAKNVELVAVIPPGMRAVGADAATNYQINGDRVSFEKILTLPPKGESTFRVQVEGVQPGDHRFRAIMTSDETTTPVVNEESTRVYSD